MRFLLVCLWIWLIILRLLPNHYNDPSMTTVTGESRETVRFATCLLLDSCSAVVASWNRYNRLRTKRLYRAHRPAVVIVTLLLASGDIESNPGPVYQYPCTVCLKPVKRNQRGIACDGCDKWTHAQCGNVGEAEYQLLTSQEGCEWFCPLCKQSELAGLDRPLPIDEQGIRKLAAYSHRTVSSNLSTPRKKRGQNKKYYMKNINHLKTKAKASYSADPEKKKAASKAVSKASYSADPEKKKAASQVSYSADPEKKKAASIAASKASYRADPEKKKAASKASYRADPEKKKDASKAASKENYSTDPSKKKAAARAYSKRSYAKNATAKSKYSQAYYAHNTESRCAYRRARYVLAAGLL